MAASAGIESRTVKIRSSVIFKHLGYRPHPQQVKVHNSKARHRVISAGRRFGKSEIGAGELDIEAVRTKYMLAELEESGKRREFWIVGPEYTDSEKEFRKHYDALKRAGAPMDKPGTYYDAHSGDMQLSMYGGKYLVLGKSAKHPERLVGEGLNGAIMAEAAKQKEVTWNKYVRPTLADFRGWSIHSSTPEGKNWFYKSYNQGKDPNFPDWESWRFGSWHNPFVYPGKTTTKALNSLRLHIQNGDAITQRLRNDLDIDPEIIDLMLELSEETFNQENAALFTEFAGRVFKDFDDDRHVVDIDFNPAWRTYAAVDYGFTNPFVWLLIQMDTWGNVYVMDEIYQSGLSIDDAARLIIERGLANIIEFYPDPASPGDTLALERHLRKRGRAGTGGDLNTRLRYIREGLKDRNPHLEHDDPERHPKLMIHRKCVNTIREFGAYRYPEKSAQQKNDPKELPMKKDDHTPEALGRFYAGHFGHPESQSTGGGARVAASSMSAGQSSGGSRRRGGASMSR